MMCDAITTKDEQSIDIGHTKLIYKEYEQYFCGVVSHLIITLQVYSKLCTQCLVCIYLSILLLIDNK